MPKKQKKSRRELLNIEQINIDKYCFIRGKKTILLGEGGSGIVYQAKQIFSPNVTVERAIKFFIFKDDLISKLDTYVSSSNFKDEIVNISRFNHQNILKIIDGGYYITENIKIPYIVSDYVDGKTLEELLEDECTIKKYFLNKENIFNLFTQILNGLIYLHNRKFYHCDIAPKNIFINLTEEGFHVIIGDLGVGHTLSYGSKKKILVTGSRKYMPPEVIALKDTKISISEFRKLQPRWDIYSLKLSFFECIEKIFKIDINKKTHYNWLNALISILHKNHDNLINLYKDIERIHPSHRRIADLPELSETDGGSQSKLIPLNNAQLTYRIRKITNHPSLVRLKNVPQLLMGSAIFPGSNHNRYEHLLGTYDNMRRALKALLQKDKFIEIFSKDILETALISSILANSTRFPFSFAVHELRNSDKELFKSISQKNILNIILQYKDEDNDFKYSLQETINEHFDSINFDIVKNIVCGSSKGFDKREYQIIYSLLNSSIDVRVLDFLQRDSLHLGLSNGYQFDFDNLVTFLDEHNNRIAITSPGVSSVEQVISARYWLYKSIYWNEPNRAYTAMLKQILFNLSDIKNFEKELIEHSLFSTPRELLVVFDKYARKKPKIRNLISLINSKRTRIFKRVFLINKSEEDSIMAGICDKISAMKYSDLDKLRIELEGEISKIIAFDIDKINLLIDIPKDNNNKLGKDINVIKYDKSIIKLTEISGIVSGINNYFDSHLQWLRIYIHPDYKAQLKTNDNSKKIRNAIKNFLIRKLGSYT